MSRFLYLILEAMAQEDIPRYKKGVEVFFNPELKQSKNGVKFRTGAGHYARYTHVGGIIGPTGQAMKRLHHYDKTAKAYLGPGGSLAKGDKVGVEGNRYIGKRAAKIMGAFGAVQGAVQGASSGLPGALMGGAIGGLASGGIGYGGSRLSTGIARKWYRGKAEKIGVK